MEYWGWSFFKYLSSKRIRFLNCALHEHLSELFMDTLHTIVKQKHLLKHPFYRLWLDGKLPQESLQKYSGQYFQLVAHLPRFISALHTNCRDETTRQQLVQNLMEEELGFGNGNVAHTELWLDFAEELNVKRSEVKNPLL